MLDLSYDQNFIRIILALGMLLGASFLDLRKREINDIYWIVFAAISVVMLVISPDIWTTMRTVGISLIIAPIALIIWRMGIFGGADAFCLIVLAALAPSSTLNGTWISPLTTLTNAAIISILPIFANLIRNGVAMIRKENIFEGFDETRLNKIIAVFLGYKAKNPKYSFAIERIEGDHKRLDLSFRHAENTSFCNNSETWVTPGIPYVIYITAGFVIQILFGDVIFGLINNLR